ncbi:MAG: hypothetical protein Q9222_000715 [Ikaeria aurantiellina]
MSRQSYFPAENYAHNTFPNHGTEHEAAMICVKMLLDDERRFLHREPQTSGEEYVNRCRRAHQFIAMLKDELNNSPADRYTFQGAMLIMREYQVSRNAERVHSGLTAILSVTHMDWFRLEFTPNSLNDRFMGEQLDEWARSTNYNPDG